MQLLLNEIEVSIILIPHNNQQKFQIRLERDIIPTIKAHPQWKFEIIIVDNSDDANQIDLNPLHEINILPLYLWPGTNIMYGPALNLALSVNPCPYVVYLCTNHGRMYDPTWIDDLINPILHNSTVAMTGSLYPSCKPADMGFPSHLPRVHVQGGVFGARAKALAAHPYTTNEKWIHGGSDIYECFQLMSAGFTLHNVETINSVWRQSVSTPEKWKYVHDYSE